MIAMLPGSFPTVMALPAVLVAVRIGVIAMFSGAFLTLMALPGVLVAVRIGVTVSEPMLMT